MEETPQKPNNLQPAATHLGSDVGAVVIASSVRESSSTLDQGLNSNSVSSNPQARHEGGANHLSAEAAHTA
eukprot:2621875-Pyramimonas_sp.AAC.1